MNRLSVIISVPDNMRDQSDLKACIFYDILDQLLVVFHGDPG